MAGLSGAAVVERFLKAMAAHDWDGMGACVADDVERIGPYGDTYRGKTAYLRFISGLLPTLEGYTMDIHRVIDGSDGRTAFAELSETVEIDDRSILTEEGLAFDLDPDGRIRRITIYIPRPP